MANLMKCDNCGNRSIMCFACENSKHYRKTERSHDRFIRNKAIDEFAEKIMEYCSMSEMNRKMIKQIAEQLKEK